MSKLKLNKPKLPKKPSELIRVALADLAEVEKLKKVYAVDMDSYHMPGIDNKCAVCFAGATIAMSNRDKAEGFMIDPSSFPTDTSDKLFALNSLRSGDLRRAFENLGIEAPKFVPDYVEIVEYEDSPRKFRKEMNELADFLESQGC